MQAVLGGRYRHEVQPGLLYHHALFDGRGDREPLQRPQLVGDERGIHLAR